VSSGDDSSEGAEKPVVVGRVDYKGQTSEQLTFKVCVVLWCLCLLFVVCACCLCLCYLCLLFVFVVCFLFVNFCEYQKGDRILVLGAAQNGWFKVNPCYCYCHCYCFIVVANLFPRDVWSQITTKDWYPQHTLYQ
jgi:hypothetical protein